MVAFRLLIRRMLLVLLALSVSWGSLLPVASAREARAELKRAEPVQSYSLAPGRSRGQAPMCAGGDSRVLLQFCRPERGKTCKLHLCLELAADSLTALALHGAHAAGCVQEHPAPRTLQSRQVRLQV